MPTPIGLVARVGARLGAAVGAAGSGAKATDNASDALDADADARRDDAAATPYRSPEVRGADRYSSC